VINLLVKVKVHDRPYSLTYPYNLSQSRIARFVYENFPVTESEYKYGKLLPPIIMTHLRHKRLLLT